MPQPTPAPGAVPDRRVRHEVRDSLTLIGFSAGVSTTLALLLTLLAR